MDTIHLLYIKYIGGLILALGAIAGIISILASFTGILSERGKSQMENFACVLIAVGFGCAVFGS